MSKKEATREYLETLSKDRVIELCLQFMFDANIAENQLDQANEKIMWLNAEIDTLKSEKENLTRTFEEASEELECAIVPKFKIGQEVFVVNTDYYYKKDYKVEKHKIVGIEDKVDRKNTYVRWYSLEFKDCPTSYSKRYKFLEKNVFATETEAEKKLQELRGGE